MAIDKFPVEATHILMFARAIGDTNPIYADAETPKPRAPRPPREAQIAPAPSTPPSGLPRARACTSSPPPCLTNCARH